MRTACDANRFSCLDKWNCWLHFQAHLLCRTHSRALRMRATTKHRPVVAVLDAFDIVRLGTQIQAAVRLFAPPTVAGDAHQGIRAGTGSSTSGNYVTDLTAPRRGSKTRRMQATGSCRTTLEVPLQCGLESSKPRVNCGREPSCVTRPTRRTIMN